MGLYPRAALLLANLFRLEEILRVFTVEKRLSITISKFATV